MALLDEILKEDPTDMSHIENFADRIKYELKRAERYRIFVSFLIFDISSVIDDLGGSAIEGEENRVNFINSINLVIRSAVREVDAISNGSRVKIGVLCPETARQGAEAAARRIQSILAEYCADHFKTTKDYIIPVEIASFPDAAGYRSIASYFDEYSSEMN